MKILFGILSVLLTVALLVFFQVRFSRPGVGLLYKGGAVLVALAILGIFLVKMIGPETEVVAIHHERLPEGHRLVVTLIRYYFNRQDPEPTLVRYSRTVATAIDTANGGTAGRIKLEKGTRVAGHTPGTFWTWDPASSRLTGFDFSSLRERRHYDGLVASRPAFAIEADRALSFTNQQGERVSLDPDHGQVRPTSEGAGRPRRPAEDALVDNLTWANGQVSFTPDSHEAWYQSGDQRRSLGKFPEGRFVASPEDAPTDAPHSGTVFVVHRAALTRSAAVQVTRVRLPSGERLWTASLAEDRQVIAAFVEPDAVVLVTTGEGNPVFVTALGASDGAIRWRRNP